MMNNNKTQTVRNADLDRLKLLAAFLVVAIHISPLQSINVTADFILTRIIARTAVPFFLAVTGYFVLGKSQNKERSMLRFLKKTGLLYGCSILLYLPINAYSGALKEWGLFDALGEIFIEGTFYHLWYLPAVMFGILLCFCLIKVTGKKGACIISLLLYVIGLSGDSYYGMPLVQGMKSIYEIMFRISPYTRNGLFYAPVFLMIGFLLADENLKKKEQKKKKTVSLAGSVIFFILMLIEGLLLRHFGWQRHDSMYLFLVPLMYCLFYLALSPVKEKAAKVENKTAAKAKDAAMLIYIFHPLVLILLRGVTKALGSLYYRICVENTLVCYILVSIGSAILAYMLLFIKDVTLSLWDKKQQKGGYPTKLSTASLNRDRAFVEIDLPALKWNVEKIKEILPAGCEFLAIVKDNAYGHGDITVARYLNSIGVDAFGVATLSEGIKLREEGVRGDILILGYTHPENAPFLGRYDLIQTVVDEAYAKKLNGQGVSVKVHIKVDTGMHRVGEDAENIDKILEIFTYPYLQVEGIFSHLCAADSEEEWAVSHTKEQIRRFEKVLAAVKEAGYTRLKVHLQSSYGTLNYPMEGLSYARMGIMMYGCLSHPLDYARAPLDLKNVLTLKARVSVIRQVKTGECIGYGCTYQADHDITAATVTIGYGDGYPRNLSGKGQVIIKGKRAPILGRISMDQLTVDVSDIEGVMPGDEVVLIGKDGDEFLSAAEVSEVAETISNELLCRLGSRLGHVDLY